MIRCPTCNSRAYQRDGKNGDTQRYKCATCGKRFVQHLNKKARCVCGLLKVECDGHVFLDHETRQTERATRW